METIKTALSKAQKKITYANFTSAQLDSEVLLYKTINKTRAFLFTHPEYELSETQYKKFKLMVERRLKHEPVAYIINNKEFYGREFFVDKNVLIPRPKTEEIINKIKLKIKNYKLKINVIDIGTGSGCIIITLAKEFNQVEIRQDSNLVEFIGIDISAPALKIAKKNAKKHGVDKKIKFYKGNLLEPILNKLSFFKESLACSNTIITANLPYITPKNYQNLQPEITKFEPKTALLTPNQDSNYFYKLLQKQIKKLRQYTTAEIYTFFETIEDL